MLGRGGGGWGGGEVDWGGGENVGELEEAGGVRLILFRGGRGGVRFIIMAPHREEEGVGGV